MNLAETPPLLTLVVSGLVVTGTPGPATLAVMGAGTAFGVRRSLPYLCGSVLGTVAVLVAAGAGLATAVLARPGLARVFLILAVCYLTYLALKIATAAPLAAGDATAPASAPSWVSGAVLALTNPKAYAGLGTVLVGSELGMASAALEAAAEVAVLAALVVTAHVCWLALGAWFATALRRPAVSRTVNVLMALALTASAVPALVDLVG